MIKERKNWKKDLFEELDIEECEELRVWTNWERESYFFKIMAYFFKIICAIIFFSN